MVLMQAGCGSRPAGRACTGWSDDRGVAGLGGETRTGGSHTASGERVSGKSGHTHQPGDDCGRDHYSCAVVDQEPQRGTRSGDAPDAQGPAVVLRAEGAHRGGLQRGARAFTVHLGGLGGRQAHVAGPAARRGAQGVGRRRVSGTGRSDSACGAARPRYDQPQSEVQELCGRVRKGEESDQGESTRQGGASLSHTEASLWIREGEISGNQEKPPSTLYLLCPGEPVCAPETVGSRVGGSVSEISARHGFCEAIPGKSELCVSQ